MDAAQQAPSTDWRHAMDRGHRARHAGDAAAALSAYAEAAGLAPVEAEPALHRGHALRLLSRTEEASAFYGLARSLDPYATAARDAEEALRRDGPVPPAPRVADPTPEPPPRPPRALAPEPPQPRRPDRTPTPPSEPPPRSRRAIMRAGSGTTGVVLDVTDLLLHFEHSRIPTGIQRVVAGVTRAAIRRHGPRARIVALDRAEGTWRDIPPVALAGVLDQLATGDDGEWQAARDELGAATSRAGEPSFGPADALVSLGSPWGIDGHLRAVRRSGARWVPFLHDCAPLERPEHCVRTLVQDYARWFGGVALGAAGLVCNSEATRTAGERHLGRLAPGLNLPMGVARLDADPRPGVSPDRRAARRLLDPRADEPYVLFVATVESRKDHLTVLRAWLALLRRHGARRVPRLVLVGSRGWHAEAALGLLENSADLGEAVLLLHGVPDDALAALYEGCLFTVYNSHLEGWGLPVTESLAWGKVPLVADLPALRESGGDAAVYVEPQNEAAMAEAVELLLDPTERAAREEAIGAAGRLRRWEDVEAEISELAGSIAAMPTVPRHARGTLPIGERLQARRNDTGRPSLEAAFAESLRHEGRWLPMTEAGAPFRGPVSLRIPLGGAAPGGRARLGVEVTMPGDSSLTLEVLPDDGTAARGRIVSTAGGEGAAGFAFDMPHGVEELALRLTPGTNEAVTLRGLMLCADEDLLARLSFVEAQATLKVGG